MADIDIERKKKSPLPWILGLLALAVLAFLLLSTCGDDEAEDTGAVVDTTTAMTPAEPLPAPATDPAAAAVPAAGAAAATGWIGGVLGGQMAGQTASGEGMVSGTPSDRGFWIEDNGQRVYAILAEPMEQMKDIDPGQRIRVSQARVLSSTDAAQIPQDVEAETKQTASGQPYFLLVPAASVEIVSGGNTTAN